MLNLSYMITTPEVVSDGLAWRGSTLDVMATIAEMGYGGVELQTRDPNAFDRTALVQRAGELGLALTGVSTAPAVVEDALFLTSPDESIHAEAVRRMVTVIDFAAECGTHATIGRIRGFARWAPDPSIGLGWFRQAVDELAEHAAKRGVRIVLEPQSRQVTDMLNTVDSALDFCASYDADVLCIEVDTYHMLAEERSVVAALVRAHASGRLAHVQISESNRLAPGWGHLNWADFLGTLEALSYDGWVAIEAEQKPDSPTVARQSYDFVTLMTRVPGV